MLLMTRRNLFLLAPIALGACKPGESQPRLPEVCADWRLESVQPADPIPRAARGFAAQYTGTPPIRVLLYEMSSNTIAFDVLQSWRAEPGKLASFQGKYFWIAESAGADQRTLNRFVSAFAKGLPG